MTNKFQPQLPPVDSWVPVEHLSDANGRDDGAESGARVAQENQRSARLRRTLPAGITIGHRSDGREKPYFVRFGPERKTESFTKEKLRNDRAEELAKTAKRHGTKVLEFDPAEWQRLQVFKQRTGLELEAAQELIMRIRGNIHLTLTVNESAEKYLGMRKQEGLPALSMIHPRLHLKRFCEEYGPLTLTVITAEHVRAWLAKLSEAGMGPVTVRHHRKNLNVFFERAKLEKWCFENPCEAVRPPRIDEQNTAILSPAEIFRLLKANRDEAIVGKLVFELYGALRCASVERLEAQHVKTKIRGVEMEGAKHKSGKRKFRQGHPPVLWAWVKHASPACFSEITEKNYDEKKKAAFIRASGWDEVPHNRLRHSCASYLLAVTKNPGFVAYLMQHTSLKMLERYEGIADETSAKMVLSMTPEAVKLTWDDFRKNWKKYFKPIPPRS